MKALVPEITKIPVFKVLTVSSVGDPNVVMEKYMKSLYGTAYYLKMKVYKPKGIKMELGSLIGRWPDAHLKPKDQWLGIWGLPVPDYVEEKDIVQKVPELPVKLETWKYNDVAQVLYLGKYTDEGPTIKDLHKFIEDSGYAIDGPSHEEVYLTKPTAKVPKTIIRYKIVKK